MNVWNFLGLLILWTILPPPWHWRRKGHVECAACSKKFEMLPFTCGGCLGIEE